MKKLCSVTVRGQQKTWAFNTEGSQQDIEDWRRDGLTVDVILNTVPAWVGDIGLTKVWCFFQDILNFRSPLK